MSLSTYVQELGEDGFDCYIEDRQNEIDAATLLRDDYFLERD